MEDVTKIDLYDLLGIPPDANEKQIKKAYRKKALSCHPDKNQDNPKAVDLFHRLSRALGVLTDGAARAAYDKVLKSRKAAELRNKALDSRRKRFKTELEEREKAAQEDSSRCFDAETQLKNEIERLRKEGSKLVEQEKEYLKEQMEKKAEEQRVLERKVKTILPSLKVKWKDTKNSAYTYDSLSKIFSKYGDISHLIVTKAEKGSALVEFHSATAAEAAFNFEKGLETNPIKLKWIQGKPENKLTPPIVNNHNNFATSEGDTAVTQRDYESLVFMKMRQTQERQRLIEQMMKEDADS